MRSLSFYDTVEHAGLKYSAGCLGDEVQADLPRPKLCRSIRPPIGRLQVSTYRNKHVGTLGGGGGGQQRLSRVSGGAKNRCAAPELVKKPRYSTASASSNMKQIIATGRKHPLHMFMPKNSVPCYLRRRGPWRGCTWN